MLFVVYKIHHHCHNSLQTLESLPSIKDSYKEYQDMRMRNKSHLPSQPEDEIHITYYAIDT